MNEKFIKEMIEMCFDMIKQAAENSSSADIYKWTDSLSFWEARLNREKK